MPELQTPAERVIGDVQSDLRATLVGRFQTVAGGPFDGIDVLTRAAFEEVWTDYFGRYEMPEASSHVAEVVTPSRIVVTILCPRCGMPTTGSVRLVSHLIVETGKSQIKVRAVHSAVDHTCGQQVLATGTDEVGTIPAFDLDDIVGEQPGPDEADPESK